MAFERLKQIGKTLAVVFIILILFGKPVLAIKIVIFVGVLLYLFFVIDIVTMIISIGRINFMTTVARYYDRIFRRNR